MQSRPTEVVTGAPPRAAAPQTIAPRNPSARPFVAAPARSVPEIVREPSPDRATHAVLAPAAGYRGAHRAVSPQLRTPPKVLPGSHAHAPTAHVRREGDT